MRVASERNGKAGMGMKAICHRLDSVNWKQVISHFGRERHLREMIIRIDYVGIMRQRRRQWSNALPIEPKHLHMGLSKEIAFVISQMGYKGRKWQ